MGQQLAVCSMHTFLSKIFLITFPLLTAVKKPSTKKPAGVKKVKSVKKAAGSKPKAPKALKPKTVKKAVKKVRFHHGLKSHISFCVKFLAAYCLF